MSPEERIQAYDEAVNVLNNYTAQEAAKVGNSQRSLGGFAEAVANPSGQTSGLANYTYNRTLRPTIDTLSANLTTAGRSQALEKQLYDALTEAKNRYEDAKNKYTVASTAPKTTTPSNSDGWNEDSGEDVTGREKDTGPASTATDEITRINNLINTVNAYASVTGGGQVKSVPTGTKFSYTLNGERHTGYVYPEAGIEIDGMSFNRSGGLNYINNLLKKGATIQNHLGNNTDPTLWKISYKLYG